MPMSAKSVASRSAPMDALQGTVSLRTVGIDKAAQPGSCSGPLTRPLRAVYVRRRNEQQWMRGYRSLDRMERTKESGICGEK
jgi:hypothetical protein